MFVILVLAVFTLGVYRICCTPRGVTSEQAVLTSVYGVQQNGHIRVIAVAGVKSSKVGTIVPRDRHAQSHVIVQLSLVSIGKRAQEQQAVSGFGT